MTPGGTPSILALSDARGPGKLPNTLTLEDMAYRTFTRNQLLASFLSRIRSKRTGRRCSGYPPWKRRRNASTRARVAPKS